MAEHLLARGHRRVAYVDSAVEGDDRAHERGDGFVAAALAAGAEVLRLTAPPGEPISAGRAVPGLLREVAHPSSACALANDHLACGALLGAQALGLRVPEDLALVGFGDFELAAHLAPGLTTLAPPRREIGERAAALLLAEPDPAAAPKRVVVDCPLVLRGSA
jgi:LacI family gluconate utilization system Gnt-I transcriptional repressor